MNRFIGLIPRYLVKNKKRTFFIALSIVVSVILLVVVRATVNAMNYNYSKNTVKEGGGNYHGSTRISPSDNIIKNKEIIETTGEYLKVGIGNFKDEKTAIEIGGFQRETYNLLNMEVLKGKYPEKNGELALEQWAKDKMFPNNNIGDSVTINYEQIIYTPLTGEISGVKSHSYKWKIVGILSDNENHKSAAIGTAAITMEEAKAINEDSVFPITYFRVKDEKSVQAVIDTLKAQLEVQDKNIKIEENHGYLSGLKLQYAIKNIGLFLILVVSTASIATIYNIFYMTVMERIKEFSTLRAIGASKDNIKILIIGEAVLLTVIFVPLALAIGYFGIKFVFSIVTAKDSAMLNILIDKVDIIKISAISVVTVIISALSPAIFGGKINPIEGIKENYINKIQGKKGKNIYKNLDFTGTMAYINIKKSKKRLIATVVSLTISIVLVICSTYLVDMFNPQRVAEQSTGGDILLNIKTFTGLRENYAYNDEDIRNIQAIPGIKSIKKQKSRSIVVTIDKSSLTESGVKYIEGSNSSFKSSGKYTLQVTLYGVDTEEIEALKPYLKEGDLDTNNFGDKPMVIAVEDLHYKDYTNFNIGDKLNLNYSYQETQNSEWSHIENVPFKVAATLKATPIRPIDGQDPLILICDNKAFEEYFGEKDYTLININVSTKSNIESVRSHITPIANSKNGGAVTTISDEIKTMDKGNMIIRAILYGFSSILAIVALINITNTISISVALRKRELGVLRAVGMSKKEIASMILKEGRMYGILSAVIGSALGVGFTYIIYLLLRADLLENELYKMPWVIILSIAAITIIITTLVSLPAARRGTKNSIVESVKAIE